MLVGTPLFDIFYIMNYTDQTARDFELERLAFQVLHRAMINRRDFSKTGAAAPEEWSSY